MKKLIIIAATAILMSACASGPTHTSAQAGTAIASAKEANKEAKKVNFEWRDTGKLIKKAQKAKGDGDFDTAVKLAKKAERQATLALAQEKEQKNAGPRF